MFSESVRAAHTARVGPRGEATAIIVFGVLLAAGGFLLGNVISIGGTTFAAFNFGVVLGAVLVVAGVVQLVRGR
jgi:hypothetical protein